MIGAFLFGVFVGMLIGVTLLILWTASFLPKGCEAKK